MVSSIHSDAVCCALIMLIGVFIFNKMSCRHGTDPGISVLNVSKIQNISLSDSLIEMILFCIRPVVSVSIAGSILLMVWNCNFQQCIHLINNVNAEKLTIGRMIPSMTSSLPSVVSTQR
jgi:nitrate reductase NapE component